MLLEYCVKDQFRSKVEPHGDRKWGREETRAFQNGWTTWCKEGSPSSGEPLYIYEDADKQPLILMPFQMCFNHENFATPLPEGFIE